VKHGALRNNPFDTNSFPSKETTMHHFLTFGYECTAIVALTVLILSFGV
jgi:hypothetical protein